MVLELGTPISVFNKIIKQFDLIAQRDHSGTVVKIYLGWGVGIGTGVDKRYQSS